MKHPNALTAVGSGGAAVGLVSLLAAFGLDLPEPAALAVVAAAPGVALFVGRRGILGLARLVWRGEPDL